MANYVCPRCGAGVQFAVAGCGACGYQGTMGYPLNGGAGGGGGGGGGGRGCYRYVWLIVFGVVALAFFGKSQTGPGRSPHEPATGSAPTAGSTSGNPTAGARAVGSVEIERIGNLYKYYDTNFMEKYRRGGKPTEGYTLSSTAPQEETEFIVERATYVQSSVLSDAKEVSSGRKIRRDQVRPVPYTTGNYMMRGDEQISAERFYYVPPSTASDAEKRSAKSR